MTDISVVIPTLNDAATLNSCLRSLDRQNYPEDAYEIIIVDGGSNDGTVSIAEEYDCRVLHEDEGTISYAREIGVREANGEYIAFTDADCVVGNNWLKKLVETIESHENVAGVGGPNVTPDDDTTFAKAVGDFFEVFSRVGARYGYTNDEITEVEHNPTCNVLYKRDVIKEVGGFNEQLVTVDDEEMDFRIRNNGYKLLFRPDAVVDHYRRPTWRRFIKMASTYGYGRGQAIRLHPELGKWFHFAPTIALVIAIGMVSTGLLTTFALNTSLLLVLLGQLGVVLMSFYMRYKTGRSFGRFVLLVNLWLAFWATGFVKGLLNPPDDSCTAVATGD